MRKKYEYEKDLDFLRTIDELRIKDILVKITVLTWNDERAIQEVQGRVISGELNIDKSSPIRRSGSLQVYIDETNKDVLNIDNIISINKKVYIELGIKNTTNQYKEYDFIWFKLGLFILTDVSIQNNNSDGLKFSINIADKMCMLDGSVGGKFTAATDIDTMIEEIATTGEEVEQKVLIGNLILELVHHLGGESLNNIAISDIDPIISTVLFFNTHIKDTVYAQGEEYFNQCIDNYNEKISEENGEETDTAFSELTVTEQYTTFINYLYNQTQDANLTSAYSDVFFVTKSIFTNYYYTTLIAALIENKGVTSPADVDKDDFNAEMLDTLLENMLGILPDFISENYKMQWEEMWTLICKLKKGFQFQIENQSSDSILQDKWSTEYEKYLTKLYITLSLEETEESPRKYTMYEHLPSESITEVDDISALTEGGTTYYIFNFNYPVGYRLEDYVFPGELTATPGNSITSVLDKVVQTMGGNFEYFYDIDGIFHYQEIKNYLNTTATTTFLQDNDYDASAIYSLLSQDMGKAVYKFDNSNIVESYQNNLQFSTIRNDFTLWGEKSTSSSDHYPIWYHLVVDQKPTVGQIDYNVIIAYPHSYNLTLSEVEFEDRPNLYKPYLFDGYTTETYYERTEEDKSTTYTKTTINVPNVSNMKANVFYVYVETKPIDLTQSYSSEDFTYPTVWIWNPNPAQDSVPTEDYESAESVEPGEPYSSFTIADDADVSTDLTSVNIEPHWVNYNEYFKFSQIPTLNAHPALYATIASKNWRNELFLDGVERSLLHSVPNYYYPELVTNLYHIYNVAEHNIDTAGRLDIMEEYLEPIEIDIPCIQSYINTKEIQKYNYTPILALQNKDTAYNQLTLDMLQKNNKIKLCQNIITNFFTGAVEEKDSTENPYDISYTKADGFFSKLIPVLQEQYKTNSFSTIDEIISNISNYNSDKDTKLNTESNLFYQFYNHISKKEPSENDNYFVDTVCWKLQEILNILQDNFFEKDIHGNYKYPIIVKMFKDIKSLFCNNTWTQQLISLSTRTNTSLEFCGIMFKKIETLLVAFAVDEKRIPYYYDSSLYPINDTSYYVMRDNIQKYHTDISLRVKEGFAENESDYNYYLDFINTSATIGKFSVQNIGRRTDAVNNTALNCMIDPVTPNLYLIENPLNIDMTYHKGYTEKEIKEKITSQVERCNKEFKPWMYVDSHILYGMTEDTYQGLYEAARDMLYVETSYNEKVTLSVLPIYYLDVNKRITIKNPETSIFGDYLIDSISVPLDVEGMMSISCTKIVDRV